MSLPGLVGLTLAVAAQLSLDEEIALDLPFAWWKFDEGAGAANSPNYGSDSNQLQGYSGVTTGVAGLAANTGNAYTVSNAVASVSSSVNYRYTGDATFEALVSFTHFNNQQVFWDCGATGDSLSDNIVYRIYVSAKGTQCGIFHEDSASANIGAVVDLANYPLATGRPYHIVWVRDTVNLEFHLYIDGQFIGSASYGTNPAGGAVSNFRAFSNADGASADAAATIDFMVFYKSILSAERIAAHYEKLQGITPIYDVDLEVSDPWVSSVRSHLKFNGANGSTTITDEIAGRTWTAVGNAQLSTTGPSKGSACLLLDGTGDYIQHADNAALELGTADWTMELDVWFNALAADVSLASKYTASGSQRSWIWRYNISSGGVLQLNWSSAGSAINGSFTSGALGLTTGQWYRLACVRRQGTIYFFVDGVMVASGAPAGFTASSTFFNSNAPLTISGHNSSGFIEAQLNGKLDNWRLSIGVSRYVEDYTPLTNEFPLAA